MQFIAIAIPLAFILMEYSRLLFSSRRLQVASDGTVFRTWINGIITTDGLLLIVLTFTLMIVREWGLLCWQAWVMIAVDALLLWGCIISRLEVFILRAHSLYTRQGLRRIIHTELPGNLIVEAREPKYPSDSTASHWLYDGDRPICRIDSIDRPTEFLERLVQAKVPVVGDFSPRKRHFTSFAVLGIMANACCVVFDLGIVLRWY